MHITSKKVLQGTNDPYAFVEFADHYTAAQALQAMNKRVLLEKVALDPYIFFHLRVCVF